MPCSGCSALHGVNPNSKENNTQKVVEISPLKISWSYYITSVLSAEESDLDSIAKDLEVNLKPLFNIFMGMMARKYPKDNDFIGASLCTNFFKETREFFPRCVSYFLKSVPVSDGDVV